MTKEQIDQLLSENEGKFTEDKIEQIRERLADVDEGAAQAAFGNLKSPGKAFLFAFSPFDRFYLGQVGLGILKWFTCGGCFIWLIIDLFTAKDRARQYNSNKVLTSI